LPVVEQDPVESWPEGLKKENTRETYARALRRLGEVSSLTPNEMLREARRDMKQFWTRSKVDASRLKR